MTEELSVGMSSLSDVMSSVGDEVRMDKRLEEVERKWDEEKRLAEGRDRSKKRNLSASSGRRQQPGEKYTGGAQPISRPKTAMVRMRSHDTELNRGLQTLVEEEQEEEKGNDDNNEDEDDEYELIPLDTFSEMDASDAQEEEAEEVPTTTRPSTATGVTRKQPVTAKVRPLTANVTRVVTVQRKRPLTVNTDRVTNQVNVKLNKPGDKQRPKTATGSVKLSDRRFTTVTMESLRETLSRPLSALPDSAYTPQGADLLSHMPLSDTEAKKKDPIRMEKGRRPSTAKQNRSIHSAQSLHWSDIRALRPRPSSAVEPLPVEHYIYTDLSKGGDVYAAKAQGVARMPHHREDSALESFYGHNPYRTDRVGPDPKDVGPGWDDAGVHTHLIRSDAVLRVPYTTAASGSGSRLGVAQLHGKQGAPSGAYVSTVSGVSTVKDPLSPKSGLRGTSLGMEKHSGGVVEIKSPPIKEVTELGSPKSMVREEIAATRETHELLPHGPFGESGYLTGSYVPDPLHDDPPKGKEREIKHMAEWMEDVAKEMPEATDNAEVISPSRHVMIVGSSYEAITFGKNADPVTLTCPKRRPKEAMPVGCKKAAKELEVARMALLGQTSSKSNVQQRLDAEELTLYQTGGKESDSPHRKPRKPIAPMGVQEQASLLASNRLSFLKEGHYERTLKGGTSVSYEDIARLFKIANVHVTLKMVQKAMYEFKTISSSSVVDMNRFDVILDRIGVKSSLLKNKLFRAFDSDMSMTVDFKEFIWGLSMLYEGSVTSKFSAEWDNMSSLNKFDSLDADGGGTLDYDELAVMLTGAKKVTDMSLLKVLVDDMFFRIDSDKSGKITFEEFQMAMLSQPVIVAIFNACLMGDIRDIVRLYYHYNLPLPANFRIEHYDLVHELPQGQITN